MVLKAMTNGTEEVARFGFSVSKRTGNAVVRNTIKRRTREVVRHAPVKNGWDVVFIARRKAGMADYHQLEASARRLLRRADLLNAIPEAEKTRI